MQKPPKKWDSIQKELLRFPKQDFLKDETTVCFMQKDIYWIGKIGKAVRRVLLEPSCELGE